VFRAYNRPKLRVERSAAFSMSTKEEPPVPLAGSPAVSLVV
jgi:hypothetical protein